jgi:hypothetical protein
MGYACPPLFHLFTAVQATFPSPTPMSGGGGTPHAVPQLLFSGTYTTIVHMTICTQPTRPCPPSLPSGPFLPFFRIRVNSHDPQEAPIPSASPPVTPGRSSFPPSSPACTAPFLPVQPTFRHRATTFPIPSGYFTVLLGLAPHAHSIFSAQLLSWPTLADPPFSPAALS